MVDRQTWARRVAEWRASGLSSPAFCADKPFTPGGLRHADYKLRQEKLKARRSKKAKPMLRIGRVLRTAAPPAPVSPAVSLPTSTPEAALVVELGAARVTVRPGVDRATLATVLELLAPRAQSGGVR